MATNNTNSQIQKFCESENRTLDDCCTHAQSILDVVNELKQKGYKAKSLTLKCPMEELQVILKKTNSATVIKKNKKKPLKSKTKLTGRELNDYLDSKIVRDDTPSKTIHPRPDLLRNPAAGSLHEIIPSIKKSP